MDSRGRGLRLQVDKPWPQVESAAAAAGLRWRHAESSPARRDDAARSRLALAAGLFVLGVLEAVLGFRDGGVGKPLSGPLAAEILVVAGLTLPLAWRRRRPLPALAVVAVALSSQGVFLSPSAPFAVGLVPLLLLTFGVAQQAGVPSRAWGSLLPRWLSPLPLCRRCRRPERSCLAQPLSAGSGWRGGMRVAASAGRTR